MSSHIKMQMEHISKESLLDSSNSSTNNTNNTNDTNDTNEKPTEKKITKCAEEYIDKYIATLWLTGC